MKKKELKTLGERIRSLRGEMTQAKFADALQIKQAMVSRYEAKKETPSPKVLLRMSQHSGKSIEWLLTGKEAIPEIDIKTKKLRSKKAKSLKKAELLELAGTYLHEVHLPETDEFIGMMNHLFKDKKLSKKILRYYRFIKFEDKAKSGK